MTIQATENFYTESLNEQYSEILKSLNTWEISTLLTSLIFKLKDDEAATDVD